MTEPTASTPETTPPPGPPAKPRERLRREELFLWPWRLLLIAGTVGAGIYAWIGMFWPIEELQRLATQTPHGAYQIGVCVFLGAELLYYAYISWAMREWREWGMIVWALGLIALGFNLRFAI